MIWGTPMLGTLDIYICMYIYIHTVHILVGGMEHVFFHPVGNVIIPTDSYFAEG